MSHFIPFARPDITSAEVSAVSRVVESGWLTTGPEAGHLEAEIGAALGAEHQAIAVNSATSGLHLALEALGVSHGDEVILPTWTFTATAEVVRYLGATPVLVDVDPETLLIDWADAAQKVTARTRAVMPVHFAGRAIDPGTIQDFSLTHQLSVVEDAAHALPARFSDTFVGAGTSDATVFSFYATKTMTTGEGGAVLTPHESLSRRMRTMRLHGIDRDVFNRYSAAGASWRYDVVAPGYKYNLPDPAAAIGRVQLARLHDMRNRREQIARAYLHGLDSLSLGLPEDVAAPGLHAWHLFVIRLPKDSRVSRDEFNADMTAAGIGTSVHFIPLHRMSYWRDSLGVTPEQFPGAESVANRVVSLPIYSSMSDLEVDRVISAVKESLK